MSLTKGSSSLSHICLKIRYINSWNCLLLSFGKRGTCSDELRHRSFTLNFPCKNRLLIPCWLGLLCYSKVKFTFKLLLLQIRSNVIFLRVWQLKKCNKRVFQEQLSISKYVVLAHIRLRLKPLFWGPYVGILSHWFSEQDLSRCLLLELFHLGKQRQKCCDSTLLTSLSVLSLAHSCMPGRSQSQESHKI